MMPDRSRPPRAIGLIPARSGSTRVLHKNIRPLQGHPAMAYSITTALDSGVFESVVVSTDSEEYADIARHYGAEVPFLRPAEFSGARSPDIDWLDDTLRRLSAAGRDYDCFSILRPTSPFRKAETIRRAWRVFLEAHGADSLRAVERCGQHPGKMWIVRQNRMMPLLPYGPAELPWHSSQYHALPEVFVQNASLEIAWSRVVFQGRTIAGEVLVPFFTEGDEGLDVNDERDWWWAERLLADGRATLPPVTRPPYRQS